MYSLVFQKNKTFKFLQILFIIVFIVGCVPGKSARRPKWVEKGSISPYYVGISSLQDDRKKAIDGAFYDAINQFYARELGIILENKTFIRKKENEDKLSIEFTSSTESKTNAVVIRGVKKVGEYIEKENGKYRAYVEIYIPEEEIKRAKELAEAYREKIKEFAKKEFSKGEEAIAQGDYVKAIFHYETVKALLKEVPCISSDIERETEARLKTIYGYNNPAIKLLNLKSTERYFNKVKIVKSREKEEVTHSNNTYYVDIGEAFRLSVEIGKPAYIYILSLWKDVGEVRLLYPNWIENVERTINSKLTFPEKSEIVAEPPSGLNYLFVIATSKPIDFDLNHLENQLTISNEKLSHFLSALKDVKYDVVKLRVIIKE